MKTMETANKQRKKFGERVEAFLEKNYALLFAPIVVAFLYITALWQYDVYPFGDKYTAASYDLSAQIAPFIEHLFDVFDGKSTLTFSYAIVGGADVTGTFLYFFISPFSFLFLIFGDGKVAHASSIVMLCKLMTIAISGAWFSQKLFRNIPDYLCIALGVTYAYCGYTFVANTYINWMDFLIYLPFTVAAFKHFVKTNKFLPFSILVACNVYTCFSIACFSLFTVFPALITYGLLCVEKERRHTFIAYLCTSFVVAILLALPVLFPALGAYSVSGRGGSLFENLWKGFAKESTGGLGSFNSSAFIDSYSESLYRKWSYIVSDSVFVILTLIWIYRKGFKDKLVQFMLIAGTLTLIPVLVDESMNLLNMGSYMSYALRFGFLNAMYFFGGACLCLDELCCKPFHAYDGTLIFSTEGEVENVEETPVFKPKKRGMVALKRIFSKGNKRVLTWAGVLGGIALLCLGFLLWYINGENYLKLMSLFGSDSSGFSASYAHSLGGLEVVIVIFLVVEVLTIVGCFFVGGKKVSIRYLSYLLVAVVAVQVFFYNGHLVIGNRSTQHEALGAYQVLNEELNLREDGYFRVKDYNDKMTACAPFTGGSNSFSVFSSVIDKDNFVTFQLFGYKGNGKNSFKSAHDKNKTNVNEAFGDSFMGYKYFVSTKSDLEKVHIQPTYELDENGNFVLDSEGEKVHLSKDGLYVYENKAVFPLGYTVKNEGFRFVADNTNNGTNRKKNQQALFAYLQDGEVSDSPITSKKTEELNKALQARAADVQVSAGKITATVLAGAGESLLLNFVAVKGYSVTVNGRKTELIDNDLKFLQVALEEGENEVTFIYKSPYPTYAAVGAVAGVVLLCAVWLVLKKTTLLEKTAPVISWAGIALAAGVVCFFMIFPTGVFLSKVVELVKLWLL